MFEITIQNIDLLDHVICHDAAHTPEESKLWSQWQRHCVECLEVTDKIQQQTILRNEVGNFRRRTYSRMLKILDFVDLIFDAKNRELLMLSGETVAERNRRLKNEAFSDYFRLHPEDIAIFQYWAKRLNLQ